MSYPSRFLTIAVLLCAAVPLHAGEKRPAEALPGVSENAGKSLPPRAEPEERPDADGWMRIGNWEVRISGSISYEIGFGGREPGGKKR